MSLTDIFEETGGFGLYQKFLTFGCLLLSIGLVSFSSWTQVFILLIPPHRCKVSPNDTEWISVFNETNTKEINVCPITFENGTLEECNYGMIYDFSLNYPTYASEHDLVCENSWKAYLGHTVYWIGTIFGTLTFGTINDNYGRRRAYQGAVFITLIGDVATYFCDEQIPFYIARFFSATGNGNIATIAFVLAIEHSIPRKRRINIFAWSLTFSLATLSVTWIGYATHHWKYLLMVVWVPTAVAVIMSYFLPESPSWLLTKGRTDEAVEYIQRIAKVNGKPISKENILRLLQISTESKEKNEENVITICSKTKKSDSEKTNNINIICSKTEISDYENKKTSMSLYRSIKTVVKSPNLRKRILCLGFIWMMLCSCYNGTSLEFNYLPFNMYIIYSIGALIEIPGTFFVVFTLDILGRRWMNTSFLILGGIFGIVSANVKTQTLMLVFVMIMRACYSSAFDISFSISSELLPTAIRGRALSFIRICGGLGSSMAPFVVNLAQKDPFLPLALFGIGAIIAGISMLTLPETTHQQLPQTIEEAENFGKKQSFWLCPFSQSHPERPK